MPFKNILVITYFPLFGFLKTKPDSFGIKYYISYKQNTNRLTYCYYGKKGEKKKPDFLLVISMTTAFCVHHVLLAECKSLDALDVML